MSENCCITCYDDYIQTFFIRAILWFSRIYNNVNTHCTSLYNKNSTCKLLYDIIVLNIYKLYHFCISQKLEPNGVPWISTSWIQYNKEKLTNIYSYNEYFDYFLMEIISSDLHTEEYKQDYINKYFCKTCNLFEINQFNPIVLLKTENKEGEQAYISRRGNVEITDLSLEKSNVRFLSIEYIHPEMDESIELQLDKLWFIVGNELFNSTFILRTLNYQSCSYVFDEKYQIKIMDVNCNIFYFGEDTYMKITKDGYELKHDNFSDMNPYKNLGHYSLSDIEHYSIFENGFISLEGNIE